MNELVREKQIEQAREISRRAGYTSVSFLQSQMHIGYITASHLLDSLVEEGFCVREDGSHIYKVSKHENR